MSGSHFDPRLVDAFLEIARDMHGEWSYEPAREEAAAIDEELEVWTPPGPGARYSADHDHAHRE
jgi:hypothetical protein